MAQHPPSMSACLQESQHTIVFRSQREVVNSGQELTRFSGWLGFPEIFYQVRDRTWIYRVRKQAQQTTTDCTNSILSNFSITATDEDHRRHQTLGPPQADTP